MKGASLAVLGLVLPLIDCGRSPAPMTAPSEGPQSPVQRTLVGQVFEIVPGGRIPAAGITLSLAVVTGNCPAPICSSTITYLHTTTGSDGRFNFSNLPYGVAAVRTSSPAHQQLCGAVVTLDGLINVEVEITSKTHPQPSPTQPALRITGQVYETTPAGRVGIAGALVYTEWLFPDMPFVQVDADNDGRFSLCGIPALSKIAFGAWHLAYEESYKWHQFSTDGTLDIELERKH